MEQEIQIGGRTLITKRDTLNGSMFTLDILKSDLRHTPMLNGQMMITVFHMTKLDTTSRINSIFMSEKIHSIPD